MKKYTLESMIPVSAPSARVNIIFSPNDRRRFSVEWQQDEDRRLMREEFWTLSEAIRHKDHIIEGLNIAGRANKTS